MEFIFNLIWLMVAALLWGGWLIRVRRAGCHSPLPGIGVQLLALAMLTAILLPVISITDDLQAAHFPAEVERTVAKNEQLISPLAGPISLPLAVALLALCPRPQPSHSVYLLAARESAPRQIEGQLRSFWSRPPPTA